MIPPYAERHVRVVWEVGKREVGGNHFDQRLPRTRLYFTDTELNYIIYPMKF